MSSLVSELWNGNLDPSRYFDRSNSKIKHIEDLTEISYKDLLKKLNSKEQELLKKYSEQMIDYTIVISEQVFNDGFSVDVKLISEAFNNVEL